MPRSERSAPDTPEVLRVDRLRRLTVVGVVSNLIVLLSIAALLITAHLRSEPLTLLGVEMAARQPAVGPGLPDGSVIAVLADRCPYPWRPYPPAQGRFVLGAGTAATVGTDAEGLLLSAHLPGHIGGQGSVELTLAEIPSHTHRLMIAEGKPGSAGLLFGVLDDRTSVTADVSVPFSLGKPYEHGRERVLDLLEPAGGIITGDGRPAARRHDNIPPFVALTFCIHTAEVPLHAFDALP